MYCDVLNSLIKGIYSLLNLQNLSYANKLKELLQWLKKNLNLYQRITKMISLISQGSVYVFFVAQQRRYPI